MLRRLVSVLLLVCGVSTAAAQKPSALKIDPDLRQNLRTLAAGLHNEVILCLYGKTRDDTTHLTEMEMPRHSLSNPTRSAAHACPDSTLGWWHNHSPYRWDGDVLRVMARPEASCKLSPMDVATALRSEMPWTLLSNSRDHICWWRFDQLRVTPLPLSPPDGQTTWKGKR